MSKGLKIILFWSLLFPTILSILRFLTEVLILNNSINTLSYSLTFIGIAIGGLLFASPIHYLLVKYREKGEIQTSELPKYFQVLGRFQRFNRLKNQSKVDQGFAISYYKLSYRRRMLRTFYMIPVAILIIIVFDRLLDFSFTLNLLMGVLFFILITIQFGYNFLMWRNKES